MFFFFWRAFCKNSSSIFCFSEVKVYSLALLLALFIKQANAFGLRWAISGESVACVIRIYKKLAVVKRFLVRKLVTETGKKIVKRFVDEVLNISVNGPSINLTQRMTDSKIKCEALLSTMFDEIEMIIWSPEFITKKKKILCC